MNKFTTTSDVTAERIFKYLGEGKRFDGRTPTQFRDLEIEFGVSNKAEGSVRVRLGKTEVIVGIKMDVSAPYPDSPNKGNLMVTAEMLPLSSPRFEAGPPKFDAIELGRVTDRGLRESGFIQFDKLCIVEGEKVWTVFVDVYSINDDGNLIDAAAIGAVAALKIAKIPKYNEETGKVIYGESFGELLPLAEKMPISVSAYKLGEHLVFDPTREEEDLASSRVTMSFSGEIISSLQKSGSAPFEIDKMKEVFEVAEKTSVDVLASLVKELNKKV